MTNLRPNSLPVESSRAALPALLAQCEEIISYVEAFDRRSNPEAARQALPRLAQMQRIWAAVSQRASKDQITAAIAMLTAGFPNMTRADLRIFGRLMRQEIATLQPSLFVLICGCRKLLQKCEFLSIAAALKSLEAEQRKARRFDYLIREYPLVLARADEKRLRDEEIARQQAETAREDQQAELKQRVKEFWPELCPSAYDDDELEMLGLTRSELLAWRKQFMAKHPEMRRRMIKYDEDVCSWWALRQG